MTEQSLEAGGNDVSVHECVAAVLPREAGGLMRSNDVAEAVRPPLHAGAVQGVRGRQQRYGLTHRVDICM